MQEMVDKVVLGARNKKRIQHRVTPGAFELALRGSLIKFEEIMCHFPLLMEYIALNIFQSCLFAFPETLEFMLMKNICLFSLVSPSSFILHDIFFN